MMIRMLRYQTQESLSKILHSVPRVALPELKQALGDEDWRVVYHSIVILTEFAKEKWKGLYFFSSRGCCSI